MTPQDPHFFAEKLMQLEHIERTKQLDQIFEWVKTGHINRSIFRSLISRITSAKVTGESHGT